METYDYIIVGAGSSGCVLAGRLSEDPAASVLLIEAGDSMDSFWVNTPAGVGKLFGSEAFNWRFDTQPVPTLGGRTIRWDRGKGLGGSSGINGMVYSRGQPMDYDQWAQLGNAGWGWDDVLPYFKRAEHNVRGADAYHGDEGPLWVSDAAEVHPSLEDFVSASDRLGYPRTRDLNAPPYPCSGIRQYTIRNGVRHTSYRAFVEPVRHRKNLTILTHALVARVLLENGEATGVEVLHGGEKRRIAAAREVILSAGSLASPQILMLSGIGDSAQLARHGIAPRHGLAGVGRNLQDHLYVSLVWRGTENSSANERVHGLHKYLEGARYIVDHTGYLALGASPATTYAPAEPGGRVNLQLSLSAISFTPNKDGTVDGSDAFPGLSGSVVLLTPQSRGHMELAGPDVTQAPLFHPNYLSVEKDVHDHIVGIRMLREIMRTEPMASRVVEEIRPGAAVEAEQQLLDYVKRTCGTGWHMVGTARMGKAGDDQAVVDERLRVHGVGRLRVVDASIMPVIVTGNTNAPCIMIGEKGADMIRQDAAPARAISN